MLRADGVEDTDLKTEKVFHGNLSKIGQLPPLLEIKGPLAKVDLSAWISGISYMLGINFIGYKNLFTSFHQTPFDLLELVICFVIFLVAVTIIQQYMGLSLRANEFGKPRQLCKSGPYRFTRNPIYVAFLLPLASFAIISPMSAIAAIVFYVVSMNFTVLRAEERDLVAIFGETYLNYASKTPRWIF